MAINDLWHCRVNCSTNNRGWAFGLWLKETVNISTELEGAIVANALFAHLNTSLIGILSNDSKFESVAAWRRHPTSARPGLQISTGGTGGRVGPALSNDNALYIDLRQEDQDAKYNGGIFLAGQRQADHSNNLWDDAYVTGAVKTFTDQLEQSVVAQSPDGGSWAISVVSKRFQPPSTPIGTPFEVFQAQASNRVMTQRRRRQKSRGYHE